MPEGPEIRICSDFIRSKTEDKKISHVYRVEKGNSESLLPRYSDFSISTSHSGKILTIYMDKTPIHVFLGMSGSFRYVPTKDWRNYPYNRLRFDDETGYSLLLHGAYLGPKYSIITPFRGTKRGPDAVFDFNRFSLNIINNLHKKAFDGMFCEVITNQEYFSGIGNYLRSTICHYSGLDPFKPFREVISGELLNLFRDTQIKSYEFGGGQLKDWKNPFGANDVKFRNWVYYKRGLSCRDSNNKTFWFHPKWRNDCPYEIK